MSYDYDKDLDSVLAKADNVDLGPLVEYIKNAFSNFLEIDEDYKKHYPNHIKYRDSIARELREYGGNTFANFFRESGPPYAEIVKDVGTRLKANFSGGASVEAIEEAILMKVASDAYEKMDSDEKRAMLEGVGVDPTVYVKGLPSALPVAAIQAAIKVGGFASYQLALIIANSVARAILGRGLSLATNAALTRGLGILAGPIGWAITAAWTLFDLAGPAYRVTIPCVIHIAMLRRKQQTDALPHCPVCNTPYAAGANFCPNCGEKF